MILKNYKMILGYSIALSVLFLAATSLHCKSKTLNKKNLADKKNISVKEIVKASWGSGKKISIKEIVKASCGSGPNDLGCSIPEEALPEGPMSFVVDTAGNIYILDQVNSRVQVFDQNGKRIKTISIPGKTFEDLALSQSGNLILLDLLHKVVIFLDSGGAISKTIKLIGQGITEAGGVGGIHSRQDGVWAGVWVEYGGGLVRICDQDANPDAGRWIVPGKFSYDGSYLLTSRVLGEITVAISIQGVKTTSTGPYLESISSYSVYFDKEVLFLTALETDADNNIYLGTYLVGTKPGQPAKVKKAYEEMVVLNQKGVELRRISMPVHTTAMEVKHYIRVTPDGKIYQMCVSEKGVILRRFHP